MNAEAMSRGTIPMSRTLMAPGCTTTQGNEMKSLKWFAVTVGMAALAACGGDETNMTNVEINAVDDNMMLPPVDMNADMNADLNADMNVDVNAADNTMNTADNTTNAY
jgi:hypothetical protein